MKTCTAGNDCEYRYISSAGCGCNYTQYCDFQLPIDSREGSYTYTLPNAPLSDLNQENK